MGVPAGVFRGNRRCRGALERLEQSSIARQPHTGSALAKLRWGGMGIVGTEGKEGSCAVPEVTVLLDPPVGLIVDVP